MWNRAYSRLFILHWGFVLKFRNILNSKINDEQWTSMFLNWKFSRGNLIDCVRANSIVFFECRMQINENCAIFIYAATTSVRKHVKCNSNSCDYSSECPICDRKSILWKRERFNDILTSVGCDGCCWCSCRLLTLLSGELPEGSMTTR